MWYIILFFATLIVDQVSKIIVEQANPSITIIPGVLNIELTYNTGASFSFLANKDWAQAFFIILTSIVLVIGTISIIVRKPKGKWILSSIALLYSGTIGNFIDRIAFGKVRDFIFVPFFANFNIADSCLCIGAFMLIVYVLFIDKDAIFKPTKKSESQTLTENTSQIQADFEIKNGNESGDNEVIAQDNGKND